MELKEFCVFIISHNRPHDVYTYETLNKYNYTGDLFIVLDDEDTAIEEYRRLYHNKILIFNKKNIADLTDEGNNFDNRRTTTHARNACFDLAYQRGYEYFLVLDDDYTVFRYRYINHYITKGYVNNLDKLFHNTLQFYKNTDFLSVAYAQGGDFIGGESCGMLGNYLLVSRKCMNSFFCSIFRRFWFIGQLNEDVNTYITLGTRGNKFLTIPFVGLEQKATQKTNGGMTDAYLKYGTYVKSFTTVMMQPSSISVGMMGFTNNRLHHRTNWKTTIPMIIDEKYKHKTILEGEMNIKRINEAEEEARHQNISQDEE